MTNFFSHSFGKIFERKWRGAWLNLCVFYKLNEARSSVPIGRKEHQIRASNSMRKAVWLVRWNSVNKTRLRLNKASFIYTKVEERSGRKNFVICLTKIDHIIVERIWNTSPDIFICKTKLICMTKLYFDYLTNLRVFVLHKPPKDVAFFSKKRHTICFRDIEILILLLLFTD